MNESLAVGGTAARVDGFAIEIEGDEIADRYVARRDRLHLQVAIRIARVTNADMAERVEHAVIGENVIACDQIHGDCRVEIGIVGAELPGHVSLVIQRHGPAPSRVPQYLQKLCAALPVRASGAIIGRIDVMTRVTAPASGLRPSGSGCGWGRALRQSFRPVWSCACTGRSLRRLPACDTCGLQ